MPYITTLTNAANDTGFDLSALNNLNIIVGRNGAGKSRLLRNIKQYLERERDIYKVFYINPERVGIFKQDPSTDTNIANSYNWLAGNRNQNQSQNFKNVSAYLLKQLELIFLRKMERDPELRADASKTFASEYLSKINSLLTNVTIEQRLSDRGTFEFINHGGETVSPENLSSGESEAISLASETMNFFNVIDSSKINVLLIDEPDVHMHPDLQARFARFITNEIEQLTPETKNKTLVLLATHSTPLICELARYEFCNLGTKHFLNENLSFRPVDNHLKNAAAFFAHPLSKSISDDPLAILEGQDDERVWQQAARSAQGKIKIFPCLAYSVNQQTELERFFSDFLPAIYDDPVAFSIRDGDGTTTQLNQEGIVRRFRLQCYAIENLLTTDDCLTRLNSSWPDFINKANTWLNNNATHEDAEILRELIEDQTRFRHRKIKDIRQLICALLESKQPWEVVVGQTIGSSKIPNEDMLPEHSLASYLGKPLMEALNFPVE